MRWILPLFVFAYATAAVALPPRLDAILAHTRSFYDIAMANGGHRAATSAGHEKSAEYVEAKLRAAGYLVSRQYFSGTFNVIAESAGGEASNTVILGAHLDSVPDGPGINDNAATVAALVEIALGMKDSPVRNKLKFAFWGGEEWGLVGSRFYVRSLPEADRQHVALYLNFDMIASPNYLLGVYTGTDYARGSYGERGSKLLSQAFHQEFKRNRSKSVGFVIGNRGDHAEFANMGIPTAGLCTGADGHKSRRAAQMFGGRAGALLDPCYHQSCDDMDNLNLRALEINSLVMNGMAERFSRSLEGLADIR